MPLMGQREYARHRGCSLGAVQKAIKAKRVPVTVDGKINSEIADRAWEMNTDHTKRSALFLAAVSEVPSPSAGEQLERSADESARAEAEDAVGAETRADRARREKALADKAEWEVRVMRGELVPKGDVKRLEFTANRITRDRVQMVPPRVAGQLQALVISAVPDELRGDMAKRVTLHAVESLLENALRAALNEAAKAIRDAARDDHDEEDS